MFAAAANDPCSIDLRIACYAVAVHVHNAEIEFTDRMSLVCRFPQKGQIGAVENTAGCLAISAGGRDERKSAFGKMSSDPRCPKSRRLQAQSKQLR
jgi:hypothetical protein